MKLEAQIVTVGSIQHIHMTTAILTARFHELLRKCTHTNMSQVKQIQAHLTTSGLLFFDVRLLGRLFSVAAGDLSHAHLLLSQIPHHHKNIFFYNTLIRSHSQTPTPHFAISIYVLSLRAGLLPDSYTFPLLLKACSLIPACPQGQSAHGQSLKLGLYPSLFLNNALIHFYSLTGQIHTARQLFDEIPLRDVVSWNSMISGYARIGDMGKARELFDEMPERNVISWSAVIAGYVQVGLSKEALDVFARMQAGSDRPNEATLVSVLAACAHLGALEQGKWAHGYLKSSGLSLNVFVGTALIDMYGKCGEIDLGLEVFSEMEEKNLLAWTAMIKGLAMHGRGCEALSLFASMNEAGVVPDDITFIGVLCACTHAGLVDEGRRIFNSMNEVYGIMPKTEHYGCMVDLLARVGLLEEARRLVEQMPMEPDALIWGALMAGCRFHGDVEMAEYVGKHLIELEPDNGAVYVLLANIYSVSGRHDNARKVWQLMKSKGLMKTPGCSSIEIRGTVHQFLVGDTSHPQIRAIMAKWEEIERLMKLEGYVSNKTDVLLDIEEEEKEEALARHSEKLAIAFGLISTSTGTVIHIVKNLRVCNDCHHVTKLISKVYNREIIVRDRTRFHHFKGGTCNCKDYW